MINSLQNQLRRLGVMFVLMLMISAVGCKSKKKAMEAAEKARTEQEAAERQREEERKRTEAEERARREAEEAARAASAKSPENRLNQYFVTVAGANNVKAANSSIDEALTLFASPDTPVLIVISEEGGQKDYDRPTTIRQYLHYLKDQKKNTNKISNLKFDASGKITEVELKKN